jgi:RNA polymerase sigma-70 factor (ECF subfamily)
VVRDQHIELPALLPRLVAFARTIVGNPETARDLVQEAVARALAARRVPVDQPAYRAWMFQIVRNAAIDELRRNRLEVAVEQAPITVDLWRFDDAHIAKLTVERGLSGLAPAHREIIALIDIAGFSYAEAAALLGVPDGTIMSRIARAREALLAAIDASTLRVLKSSHGR